MNELWCVHAGFCYRRKHSNNIIHTILFKVVIYRKRLWFLVVYFMLRSLFHFSARYLHIPSRIDHHHRIFKRQWDCGGAVKLTQFCNRALYNGDRHNWFISYSTKMKHKTLRERRQPRSVNRNQIMHKLTKHGPCHLLHCNVCHPTNRPIF